MKETTSSTPVKVVTVYFHSLFIQKCIFLLCVIAIYFKKSGNEEFSVKTFDANKEFSLIKHCKVKQNVMSECYTV